MGVDCRNPGGVPQAFEIRRMQALLNAFQDPDWYFFTDLGAWSLAGASQSEIAAYTRSCF